MTDSKEKRGPADRTRVNVNEDYELEYWSNHFGVSSKILRESVARVGPMVADVQHDLHKHKHKPKQ